MMQFCRFSFTFLFTIPKNQYKPAKTILLQRFCCSLSMVSFFPFQQHSSSHLWYLVCSVMLTSISHCSNTLVVDSIGAYSKRKVHIGRVDGTSLHVQSLQLSLQRTRFLCLCQRLHRTKYNLIICNSSLFEKVRRVNAMQYIPYFWVIVLHIE